MFNFRTEEYYKKFIELQEKLRNSEEARLKLEVKFNQMVQIAKEEEQNHFRNLKSQYNRFVEEDRKRQDRNERILRTLEKIEGRVAVLTAKTERFKLFRQHYNSFLSKGSKTKESTTSEQNSNQQSKRIQKRDEVVQTYRQNIPSHKLRDLKQEEKEERGKLTLDVMPKFKEKHKQYGERYHYDQEASIPNYVSSVADDIMNSIISRHYHKSNDKHYQEKELNNNVEFDQCAHSNMINGPADHENDLQDVKKTWEKRQVQIVASVQQSDESSSEQRTDGEIDSKPERKLSSDKNSSNRKFSEDLREVDMSPKYLIQENSRAELAEVIPLEPLSQEISPKTEQNTDRPQVDDSLDQRFQETQPVSPLSVDYLQPKITEESSHPPPEDGESKRQRKEIVENNQNQENDDSVTEFLNEGDNLQESKMYDQFQQNVVQNSEQEQFVQSQEYCDENDKEGIFYNHYDQPQYDENGQLILYNESGQSMQSPYKDQAGYLEEYDQSSQPIQQYDNMDGIAQPYEEVGLINQHYDETGQVIQHYEAGQVGQHYDGMDQVIQQYDENAEAFEQYDTTGQIIQQYNDNSQIIQNYDENGQIIQPYGENDQYISSYGEDQSFYNDQMQYDANGQYMYDNQYDGTGQALQECGSADELTQLYPSDKQHFQQCDEQFQEYEVYDQGNDPTDKTQTANDQLNVQTAESVKEDYPLVERKTTNPVIEMLDTDTESVKQDTKTSNDSDFDFSNT